MNIDEVCYKVIGAAMAVHRHFGPGYLEEVYKNAMMVELEAAGLRSEKEVPIEVAYKGVRVGDCRLLGVSWARVRQAVRCSPSRKLNNLLSFHTPNSFSIL